MAILDLASPKALGDSTLRPVGTLEVSIPRADFGDRWEGTGAGVYGDNGCDTVVVAATSTECASVTYTTVEKPSMMSDVFQPFAIVYDRALSVACWTALSIEERARTKWRNGVSRAVANQLLYSGPNPDVAGLADLVTGSPFANVPLGIAQIEQAMATRWGNLRGYIYVPPSVLTMGALNGLFELVGEIYFTPGGHIVIGDAGFTGNDSNNATATPPWVYATSSPVVWDVSEPQVYVGLAGAGDLLRNEARVRVIGMGIAAFDTSCKPLKAQVTLA